MIYIIVLIYTLFLFIRYNIGKSQKNEKSNYYFLLTLVSCIAGFGYRLGMDTIGYMENFDKLDSLSIVLNNPTGYRYEPAFVLLMSCCKSIWNDFTLLQLIIAIFVNTVYFWFFRHHTRYFYFAIFMYFIYQFWNINFEIKRESIAIAFFLLGIHSLLKRSPGKKDYFKYYLCATIASCFHHWAFLTFFYPLLTNIRINRKFYIFFSALFLLSFIGSFFIKNVLISFNYLLSLYTNESISTYLDSSKYGTNSFYSPLGLIFNILIPFYIIISIKDIVNKKILSLALVTFIISLLTTQVFILYRFNNYFCPFLFIVYAEFAGRCCLKRSITLNKAILIISVSIIIIGKTNKENYIRYAPYESYFSKGINKERESEYYRLSNEYLFD